MKTKRHAAHMYIRYVRRRCRCIHCFRSLSNSPPSSWYIDSALLYENKTTWSIGRFAIGREPLDSRCVLVRNSRLALRWCGQILDGFCARFWDGCGGGGALCIRTGSKRLNKKSGVLWAVQGKSTRQYPVLLKKKIGAIGGHAAVNFFLHCSNAKVDFFAQK